MKLRILKSSILAGVGTFKPGAVVIIPNDVAQGWLRNGAARVEDGTPWVPGAETTPEPKVHKHYFRKDGTCACGAVKGQKAKKSNSEPTARQIKEAASAEADKKPKAKPKTQIEPDPVPVSE